MAGCTGMHFVVGAADADAVVVISEDVKVQAEMERLPIDPQRLHAIPFGTEHLTGNEPTEMPRELAARGFVEGQFILCLGTDYAHKNRDIAMAVSRGLRERGHSHALVMAGPTVPYGSSRLSEANLKLHHRETLESAVFLLPDLPSAERNWLVRHADLVLYPSSAEGFGLVPFEAARFGTPTLFTRFGPLQELAPDIPVSADDWSPETLAEAADSLLSDPALARPRWSPASPPGRNTLGRRPQKVSPISIAMSWRSHRADATVAASRGGSVQESLEKRA